MKIGQRLLEDYCKQTILSIADEIGGDAVQFDMLMDLFFSGDPLIEQRTAWVLSTCLEVYPELAEPYIESLIDMLDKDVHDAVRRCIIRSLAYVDMPEHLHGRILDRCFDFLSDRKAAVAVLVFSMSVIDRLSETYPDISHELHAYLEEEMDYGTAGFKSRARKILKARR